MSILFLLLATACAPGAAELDAQATQVAQTVVAGITATARANPTGTPLPTDTPEPTEPPATATTAPTATLPLPTATDTATPAPTPTATLPAGDPALTLGAPTRVLAFDPNVWFLFEDDHLKMEIEDGQLELTAFNAESWEGWSTTGYVLENFYLEVTGTTGPECSGKDRFGVIVRADDPNEGYLFGISCDGFFRLRSWDGESFTTLQEWTSSSHIRIGPNETNRIGLMARGDELRLFVNGFEVAVVEDDAFDQGAFGVFVSSASTEDFIVTISDARYWVLQ
jgi:hypothetical protein